MATTPVVKKDPANPEPDELIAASIIKISEGMQAINKGPLNRRAILVLLKDATGLTFAEITKVLDAQADLRRLYLK